MTVLCNQCNKQYKTADSLANHIRRTHDEAQIVHKCGQCEKQYKQKAFLQHHIDKKHLGIIKNTFKCPECTHCAESACKLKIHVNTVHLKIADLQCPHCEKKFGQQGNLTIHVNAVHLKIKPYTCDVCNKGFSENYLLNLHVKKVHTKANHSCTECDKKYTTEKALAYHVNVIHLGKKDHQCPQCEYKTDSKAYLNTHIRTVHLKLKDLQCDKCELQFGAKKSLRDHQIVHNPEHKYVCEQCGMNFKRKKNLNDHIKRMHNGKVIPYAKNEEKNIFELLRANSIPFDYNSSISLKEENATKKYFLDFVVQVNDLIIVLEVDEHGHRNLNLSEDKDEAGCKNYSPLCEQRRMMDTVAYFRKMGEVNPIVFIRYNPHVFNLNGKKHDVNSDIRHQKLIDVIKNLSSDKDFAILYMYYDAYTLAGATRCDIWDHREFSTMLANMCLEPVV